MLNEIEKGEVVSLVQDLVNIRSYSGEEKEVAEYLLEYLKKNNFDEAFIDKNGNVLGRIKGKKEGLKILFDGHIDTVPVSENWTKNPFNSVIEDGKIYGRGTTDMKGACASFLYAVNKYKNDTASDFSGEIWVSFIVHEEGFEGISAREVSKKVNPDIVVIGEASEMDLKISQRGRAEIVVETFGKPCHSSNPKEGINAVYSMMKLLEEIRKIETISQEGMFGENILELTDIKSLPYPGLSVVPEYCVATFDRRLLVGETKDSVLSDIKKIIEDLKAKDKDFDAKVSYKYGKETCYTGETIEEERFFPAWRRQKDEDYIVKIKDMLNQNGYSVDLTGYSFCTNGSHYGGEANIPCIGIGPGKEKNAHIVDEYVKVKDIEDITDYYYLVCKALL